MCPLSSKPKPMKHRLLKPLLALVLPVLLGAAAVSTHAQLPPPMKATEIISGITVVPGQPIDLWFPNAYDPLFRKYMYFEGTIGGPPQSGGLLFWFDWTDPNGQPVNSPQRTLQPGTVFEDIWIPFCPERVSIHFEVPPGTSTAPFTVEGVFVHECIIPEPSEYAALAGLGLIGFTIFRRWHGATRG